ncbi:hypothetical protein SESBI_03260 [Sesbania bispinosa]|nr:hypothetical protein SESBI_03260 [Sesbania bispinosa]
MRLQLNCDKLRSKALKIAAEAQGVSSVSLEGEERDELVVTGDVDAVCLARELRKKFRCVTLVSVEQVKPDAEENKDIDNEEEDGGEDKIPSVIYTCGPCPSSYVVYDPYPNNCSIM